MTPPFAPTVAIYSPKRELKRFLDEDVGKGDITSKLLQKKNIVAKIITREETIIAGTKYARDIFALKKCKTKIYKKDGKIAKAHSGTCLIIGLKTTIKINNKSP